MGIREDPAQYCYCEPDINTKISEKRRELEEKSFLCSIQWRTEANSYWGAHSINGRVLLRLSGSNLFVKMGIWKWCVLISNNILGKLVPVPPCTQKIFFIIWNLQFVIFWVLEDRSHPVILSLPRRSCQLLSSRQKQMVSCWLAQTRYLLLLNQRI